MKRLIAGDDTAFSALGSIPNHLYWRRFQLHRCCCVADHYRARMAVGVASIASSRYFYIDPKATVS